MSLRLPDHIRAFLDDERYVVVATVDEDGTPRQATVWYTLDGDEIVINSAIGRRWPSNLLRDPRISLAVLDAENGYRWVGLNGTVRPVTDLATARADIVSMARRYPEEVPGDREKDIARFESQQRISFRITPTAIHDHLDA